jgi:hypothetical protein
MKIKEYRPVRKINHPFLSAFFQSEWGMLIIALTGGVSTTYVYAMRKRYGILVDLVILLANCLISLARVST